MSFALVVLTYRVPLDEVLKHVDDHRAYLATLHKAGKLLASGPFVPRTGGALLLAVDGREEALALVAADPFQVRGIAEYDGREWAAPVGAAALAALAQRPG